MKAALISNLEFTQDLPIFFISDLHLSNNLPKTCAAFFNFIIKIAPQAQALFILGDLFEYWLGDDFLVKRKNHNKHFHAEPLMVAHKVVSALKDLGNLGTRVFITPGNRDFLLGAAFAKAAQVTLLSEVCELKYNFSKILLAHGDSLCVNDISYQRYRKIVLHPWFLACALSLPLRFRQKLAYKIRNLSINSQKKTIKCTADEHKFLRDVDFAAVNKLLEKHQASILIHGHTHQAKCHQLNDGKMRWVLSDWYMENNVTSVFDSVMRGNYLKLDYCGLKEMPIPNVKVSDV